MAAEATAAATAAKWAEPGREAAVQKGEAAEGAIPAESPKHAAWSLLLPSHPQDGDPEDTGGSVTPGMNEKITSPLPTSADPTIKRTPFSFLQFLAIQSWSTDQQHRRQQ